MRERKTKRIFAWLLSLMMVVSVFFTGKVPTAYAATNARLFFSSNCNLDKATVEYKIDEGNWIRVTSITPDDGNNYIVNVNSGSTVYVRVQGVAETYHVGGTIGTRGNGSPLSASQIAGALGDNGFAYEIAAPGDYEIERLIDNAGTPGSETDTDPTKASIRFSANCNLQNAALAEYKFEGDANWLDIMGLPGDNGNKTLQADVDKDVYIKIIPNDGMAISNNARLWHHSEPNGNNLTTEQIGALTGAGLVIHLADTSEYEFENLMDTSGGNSPGPSGDSNITKITMGGDIVYDSAREPKIQVPKDLHIVIDEITENGRNKIAIKPEVGAGDLWLPSTYIEGDGEVVFYAGLMLDAPEGSDQHHVEQDNNITIFSFGEEGYDGKGTGASYAIYAPGNVRVSFDHGNFRAAANLWGGIYATNVAVTDLAELNIGMPAGNPDAQESAHMEKVPVGFKAPAKSSATDHSQANYIDIENAQVNIFAESAFENYGFIRAMAETKYFVDADKVFDNVDQIVVQTGGSFDLNSSSPIAMPGKVGAEYYTEIGQILNIDREGGRVQDCVQYVDCEVGDFSDKQGRYIYTKEENHVSVESTTGTLWSLGYQFSGDGDDVVTNGNFDISAGSGLREVSDTNGGSYFFEEGTEVKFKLLPDAGYKYDEGTFCFNGDNSEEVVKPTEDPGVYIFTMPGHPIHVSCNFIEADSEISIAEDAGINGANVSLPEEVDTGIAELAVEANELSAEQKDAFEKAAGELEIGTVLDLSLNQYIDKIGTDEAWRTPITDTKAPVTVTLALSEEDAGKDNYSVIREHNGEVTVLDAVFDSTKGALTFESDGFSTYAIAYTEEDVAVETKPETKPETPVTPEVTVSYHTHIQTFGDEQAVKMNGQMAGTSGMAKRLENIWIKVSGNDKLGIQYSTHCQTYGWLPWSINGELNGTSGEAKRLEAIKIQLTGADKDKYDVYYRVHAQSYGWLAWAKNGEPSGTAGYAKRLEGIQVVILKKGSAAPGLDYMDVKASVGVNNKNAYIAKTASAITIPGSATTANVMYKTHVQSFGWQPWKTNGQMSGTSGIAKRLEGINIKLSNCPYAGGIRYMTHIQKYGWEKQWKADGAMSGTSGEAKRLEAIKIELTGEMAKHYDVYYRVHAQSYGWLAWAKNGESAGTAGLAKRLEGIQIILVPKGEKAPGATYDKIASTQTKAFIKK